MAEATAPSTPAPEAEETEGNKPGKSKKLLFILIGVVVLGGAAATTAYFMMSGSDSEAEGNAGATPAVEENAGLVTMDSFLVNLNNSAGERYMKVTLRFSVLPASVAEEIGSDDLLRARLRDRVLTILTAKTYEDIGGPLGKENLRLEIQAQLNPLLGDGQVQDVLFSEFVVQ